METTSSRPNRVTPDDLDRIRADIDWRALFEGLGLQRDETRSKPEDWWAVTPFGDSGKVSFHMRPGGVWYDFSVRAGGGPIELVQGLKGGNCFEAGRLIFERGWIATERAAPSQKAVTRDKVDDALGDEPSQPDPAERNPVIRQDLRDLLTYHDDLAAHGLSEQTCADLGIGYLAQGRSPLRNHTVFQIADAQVTRKSEGERVRVILSHIGRKIDTADETADYQLYDSFDLSLELFGQDRLWLDAEAAAQITETGFILLTGTPLNLAKAHEAGLRNAAASFGETVSPSQCATLAELAAHHGITRIVIAFDREDGSRDSATDAAALLAAHGLTASVFDWNAPVGKGSAGAVHIPRTITDLAGFSAEQLAWLRARHLL